MLEGQQISLESLPSKGMLYPSDIEIYVRPMTAKEEMSASLERFGTTKANYYDNLLKSVTIKGNFDPKKLLLGDIQFIDLVRRLFTFELNELLYIKGVPCGDCQKELDIPFMFAKNGSCKNWVQFEEYDRDVFGKEYTFLDGTQIKISPITTDSYIRVARKYLSNAKDTDNLSEYLIANLAASVVSAEGRVFESMESMRNYFTKYFSEELYKYKDLEILKDIGNDIGVSIKPFEVECKHCFNITEVGIEPSMRFHQE